MSSAVVDTSSRRGLNGIELRLLRSFVTTADELHFGRAAALLHLSQPALSRQISRLERQLGCALLARSTHHVELTAAGEALLAGVRPVLGDVDRAVSAARAADTSRHPDLARLITPLLEAVSRDADVAVLRGIFESVLATQPIPRHVDVRSLNAGGVPSLAVAAATAQPRTVLHLHGGGGVMGSAFGYRGLAAALSEATGRAVVLPDHRLAPEHACSSAIDDASAALEWLMVQVGTPRDVVLSGDGAGARLAVDVLVRRHESGLPRPGRLVLMEPWFDVPDVATSAERGSASPVHSVRLAMSRYQRDEPRGAGSWDLRGLPPVLLQAGSDSHAEEADRRFAAQARDAGVAVTYERYPAAVSPLHVFWDHLPEARRALSRIAAFLQVDGDLVTSDALLGSRPVVH